MIPAVSGDRAVLCHKIDYHSAVFQCNLDQESFQISILKFFSEKQKPISVQELLVPAPGMGWVLTQGTPPKRRNTVRLSAPVSCLKQVCSSISEG